MAPNVQDPDIELPDTVPVYCTSWPCTVPKWMELPWTWPSMFVGTSPNPEILMVPARLEPVSVQVRLKVPLKLPR